MRQFVADASHELRTPLTAIRGFAEYYRQRGGVAANGSDGQLSREDLDRIMHRVETEATRMGLLVEDCCCWPGSTSSGRSSSARWTCWPSPPTPCTTPA